MAFCVAFNQNEHLIGKKGLEPANKFMARVEKSLHVSPNKRFSSLTEKNTDLFLNVPTLLWFFNWSKNIDFLLNMFSLTGMLLILIRIFQYKYQNCVLHKGMVISLTIIIMGSSNSILMIILWLLYHSIVNVGQTFYSFGWESQLLESGFLAIFLVPLISMKKLDPKSSPSYVTILLYRWLLFRIMMGAVIIFYFL